MPLTEDEENVDVVRIVHGVRGQVDMAMELTLRFAFGQAVPWVRRRDYGMSAIAGPDAVELHTQVPLEGRDMKTHAEFRSAKARVCHSRCPTIDRIGRPISLLIEPKAWSAPCHGGVRGPSNAVSIRPIGLGTEAVMRSLITLKLLTFKPTGGIVAAPTTSLPEIMGGARIGLPHGWIRDSAMTLYALLNAGYREEAEAWRQWLLRAAAGHPEQLQIMYGIAGERWLPELEVSWLPGYENSVPVRVGNGAMAQRQLDVFGELIERCMQAARRTLVRWRMRGDCRSRCSTTSRGSGTSRITEYGRSGALHARTPTHG